jgi:cobalt-zinc-cadmium efflux system membrane fusion protein
LSAVPFVRTSIAVLAGALLLPSGGCQSKAAPDVNGSDAAAPSTLRVVKFDPDALARLGVVVAAAGEGEGASKLRVPGSLEYNLEKYAEVGVLVEGRVGTVAVRVGDRVKKGQVLATIQVPSIANAQAEYLAARAAATEAKQHAEREDALLKKELTTLREAQVARTEAMKASAALAAAEARLQVLGVPLPSSQENVRAAGVVTLRSPIDGFIVRRDAVLGAFLQPNEKAFVVADPSELWATVDVFESDLPYFRINAPVELHIDAMPGKTFHGRIALVEPQLGSASRALRARIAVDNSDGELRAGLFVRAAVEIGDEGQGRLLVPSAAVQPLADEDVVFAERERGVFEVRPVRLGRRTAQVVEIVAGLSKGERIAVEGGFLLRGEITKQ